MKNSILSILFFLLTFLLNQSGYTQICPQGLVQKSVAYPTYNDSTKEVTASTPKRNKIWFKDSCVIYEFRVEHQSSSQTVQGTIIKNSYPVGSYIYMDLRTLICQVYLNFKDTALPFNNFQLKPEESLVWNFYYQKNINDIVDILNPMTDTIINKKLIKRIKVTRQNLPNHYLIYYLTQNPQTIFHLKRSLDKLYPGYKAVRWDLIDIGSKKIAISEEYEFIRDKLTDEEISIFKKWSKNALSTNLPLVSYQEAQKNLYGELEHENPTIKILPLRR